MVHQFGKEPMPSIPCRELVMGACTGIHIRAEVLQSVTLCWTCLLYSGVLKVNMLTILQSAVRERASDQSLQQWLYSARITVLD